MGWKHYIPGKTPETITGSSPGKQFKEMIGELQEKVICDVDGDDKYIFVRKTGPNGVKIEFQPGSSGGASSPDNPPSEDPEYPDPGEPATPSTAIRVEDVALALSGTELSVEVFLNNGSSAIGSIDIGSIVRVEDVALSMSGTSLSVEVTLTNGSSKRGSIDIGSAIRSIVENMLSDANPLVGVKQSEWDMSGSSLNHTLKFTTYNGGEGVDATPEQPVDVVGCAAYLEP